MTVVFSKTGVHDYDSWSKAFESHEELRRQANIRLIGVFRNADDANDLLIAIDVPDAETFGEQLKTPEFQTAIRESGISTDVEYWKGSELAVVPLRG